MRYDLNLPLLGLLVLLQQMTLVSSSRDLLLNAPASKDSLFLSQPSRDWGPGGKLAEAARRKHNAKAARLRSSVAASKWSVSTQQSDQNAQSYNANHSGSSGSGSGSELDDRIRAGMRFHLDQNGLPSDPDQDPNNAGQDRGLNKDAESAGKSEDRLITSGQVQADRKANRIAKVSNQEGTRDEALKDHDSHPEIKQTAPTSNEPTRDESRNQPFHSDQTPNQNPQFQGKAELNRIANQRPPAEIIQTQPQTPALEDETWERSNLPLFSSDRSRAQGRSGRRYPTEKGGLLNSLKKLSTSFIEEDEDEQAWNSEYVKSKGKQDPLNEDRKGEIMSGKIGIGNNPQRQQQEQQQERERKLELEMLKGKNREEALKQAEEAARNAVEDEKKFRVGSKIVGA